MKIAGEIIRRDHKEFDTIEFCYSIFHFVSGNPRWFVRIWRKNWILTLRYKKEYGESYGRNKFEAYRKALKDLNP